MNRWGKGSREDVACFLDMSNLRSLGEVQGEIVFHWV